MAASTSSQTRWQRRHTSAHTRQCSCIRAFRSHSSPDTLHACAHACTTARVMSRSYPVCRVSTRAVFSHISAQSRFNRVHLARSATICSPRSASEHAVPACVHSRHVSMLRVRSCLPRTRPPGYTSSIAIVSVVIMPPQLHQLGTPPTQMGRLVTLLLQRICRRSQGDFSDWLRPSRHGVSVHYPAAVDQPSRLVAGPDHVPSVLSSLGCPRASPNMHVLGGAVGEGCTRFGRSRSPGPTDRSGTSERPM